MNPDSRDLLFALREADARFLIVGAYAVSVHAEPRATGDLDVCVEPTPENGARVYEAPQRFGAPPHDLTVADLATPDIGFQIGLPPRRIDILTSITAVGFAEAWARSLMPMCAFRSSGGRPSSATSSRSGVRET